MTARWHSKQPAGSRMTRQAGKPAATGNTPLHLRLGKFADCQYTGPAS